MGVETIGNNFRLRLDFYNPNTNEWDSFIVESLYDKDMDYQEIKYRFELVVGLLRDKFIESLGMEGCLDWALRIEKENNNV